MARIADELREQGVNASRNRIARLMKKVGLRRIMYKKFRVQTTESNHNYPAAKNVLNRAFTADRPGQKWVSDITARAAPLYRHWSGMALPNRDFGSGRPKSGGLGHER
ncbi:IS3 family transposase [Spirosoma endbachense]|uniref:IS3 family transposase n=1 Tax=Spirosoma endbachense TaxID=2666025 RepID=UPI0013913E91